jgi:hypothetical protein
MCMAEAMCHVTVPWLWWLVGHAVTCTCVFPFLNWLIIDVTHANANTMGFWVIFKSRKKSWEVEAGHRFCMPRVLCCSIIPETWNSPWAAAETWKLITEQMDGWV